MALFMRSLKKELKRLNEHKIRLRVIGDLSGFSHGLQNQIKSVEEVTASNTQMTLVIAANYGGRWDIAQAAKSIAERVALGELAPEDINETLLGEHMQLADLPPPDLLIRTSGKSALVIFYFGRLPTLNLSFFRYYGRILNNNILMKQFKFIKIVNVVMVVDNHVTPSNFKCHRDGGVVCLCRFLFSTLRILFLLWLEWLFWQAGNGRVYLVFVIRWGVLCLQAFIGVLCLSILNLNIHEMSLYVSPVLWGLALYWVMKYPALLFWQHTFSRLLFGCVGAGNDLVGIGCVKAV